MQFIISFLRKMRWNIWKREHQDDLEYTYDFILVTIGEIIYEYKLIETRFRSYNFVE